MALCVPDSGLGQFNVMKIQNLDIPDDKIAAFCRKWRIVEFSLFGSVLRDDFKDSSDIDVLVKFSPDATVSYWDWPEMTDELARLFGRRVDLVEKQSVVNPFIRHSVLTTRRVVYAA